MKKCIVFILCFLTWLIFSGLYDFFHITLGLVASVLVTALSSNLLFENQSKTFSTRLHEIVHLPLYALWLLKEIFKANIHVLYLAYHPNLKEKISPRVFSFKVSKLKDPFSIYVMGMSITLVPGTVTVLIENDLFTVHAISEEAAEGLPEPMETWVAKAFSNKEESDQ